MTVNTSSLDTTTPAKALTPARLLEGEFWEAVENIGSGYYDQVDTRSEDGLRGYADGVKHVLIHALERLHNYASTDDDPALRMDTFVWVRQIRAAVGEQLRRRDPQGRCCPGRFLNEALCHVRDWRIALWDAGDDSFMYRVAGKRDNPSWVLERKLDSWTRAEHSAEEYELAEAIRNEIRALRDLYFHVGGDREWQRKNWERRKAAAAAVAPDAGGAASLPGKETA